MAWQDLPVLPVVDPSCHLSVEAAQTIASYNAAVNARSGKRQMVLGLSGLMLMGVAVCGALSHHSSSRPSHDVQSRAVAFGPTGATSTSADIMPQLRAEGRSSSIEPASKTRETWNLWATAYTAFVHELAPSEESIKLWWTELAQELPTREFFESQMNELKAVQAKVAPVRRGGLVTMQAGKRKVAPKKVAPKKVAQVFSGDYSDNAGLQEMAVVLNPKIGYWDPLDLAGREFWGQTNDATIGFLREAEIKHGRIAMFGFVGYIVHANGIRWPWKGPWENIPTDISPQEMWDLTPAAAKYQIILTIGFLEFWRESANVLEQAGEAHYMRGGKPGYFPPLAGPTGSMQEGNPLAPHPVPLNLFDPFKLSAQKSPEEKARGLIMEINNGRLAMIGLFGFLAESQTEGSVPALTSLGLKHYDGNIMAPFANDFSFF